MRASVERAALLAALSRITGVVERKQTTPILGNVFIEAGEGVLTLRGTDLDMEAIEVVAADVTDCGVTTAPADKLFEIARNADASSVSLDKSDDDPRLVVKAGRSRFNLPTLAAGDFPRFDASDLGEAWAFNAKLLADMVSRVAFARGDTATLTAFSGIYLQTEPGALKVVACHNSGLAYRTEPAEGADLSAILLPKATNQIARWLSAVGGDCEIRSSGALVQIRHEGSTLTTKVFDGAYVDYQRVLMAEHEVSARTDREALQAALRRVLIMADGKVRSIKLRFADGSIVLQTRDTMSGEGADEIAAEYAGPPAEFMLIADKLQAALQSLTGDIVQLAFAPEFVPGQNKSGQVVVTAPCEAGMIVNLMQARA